MSFTNNIDIGNIIAAVSVIITIITLHKQNQHAIVSTREDIAEIRTKVNAMWDNYTESYGATPPNCPVIKS